MHPVTTDNVSSSIRINLRLLSRLEITVSKPDKRSIRRIIKRTRASNCEDTSESASGVSGSRVKSLTKVRDRSWWRLAGGRSRIGSLLTIADLIFSRRDGTRFNEGGIAAGHKTHACSKQVKQRPGNRLTDPGTGPGSGETRRTYWKKRAGTCPGTGRPDKQVRDKIR